MLFNSIDFLIFFPAVLLVYFIVPHRIRPTWMLLSSYYFYMSWNVQYGCLILLVTAIGYGGGLLLAQNKVRQGKRRLAVLTGRDSIFSIPLFVRSVCVSRTVQMTSDAGIMNHTIPIKPWIKKFFSGVMGIPRRSKFISALSALGIHIMITGIRRIRKIFERRIFWSSTLTKDKKLIRNTSFLSDK